MSTHIFREAVLAKYAPKPLTILTPSTTSSYRKKGKISLEEFYQELTSKYAQQSDTFHTKNAAEIESMLMKNRHLIETRRKLKK